MENKTVTPTKETVVMPPTKRQIAPAGFLLSSAISRADDGGVLLRLKSLDIAKSLHYCDFGRHYRQDYMAFPTAPSISTIYHPPSPPLSSTSPLASPLSPRQRNRLQGDSDNDLLSIAKIKLLKNEDNEPCSLFAAFKFFFFNKNVAQNSTNKRIVSPKFPPRSPCQWVSVVFCYLILYTLVLLPIVPFGIFYRYLRLDVNHPRHSQIILEEPGLNFRPYPVQPGDDGNNKTWGALVQFNRFDRDRFQQYVYNIDAVVNKYEAHTEISGLNEKEDVTWTKRCTFDDPADVTHACILDARGFGTYCYRNMEYGYPDGQPCFLLRVNKVHGWVPEPYQSYQELIDAGFPLDDWEEEDFDPKYIPISCTGETDVDHELLGPVDYIFPFEQGKKGIPTYYFPYLNQVNYKSPGIMVNFWNVTTSVVIRVKCLLWARNVPHTAGIGQHARLRGGVQFELMVDNGIMQRDGMPGDSDEWYLSPAKK